MRTMAENKEIAKAIMLEKKGLSGERVEEKAQKAIEKYGEDKAWEKLVDEFCRVFNLGQIMNGTWAYVNGTWCIKSNDVVENPKLFWITKKDGSKELRYCWTGAKKYKDNLYIPRQTMTKWN